MLFLSTCLRQSVPTLTTFPSYQDAHGHHNAVQPCGYDEYDIDAPACGQARRSLEQCLTFRTQFADISSIAAFGYAQLISAPESWSDDRTRDNVSRTNKSKENKPDDKRPLFYLQFLPFAYPYLPWKYPRVPMPSSPQVIVLDIFGAVLVSVKFHLHSQTR